MGLSDGNGATAVVELLQELVRGQKELNASHKELAASHKRMEARQEATERLLMEVVAQQATMVAQQATMVAQQATTDRHLAALADIVKNGFERVGQELVKVNTRIDETNASLRLMRGATMGALEHDDSRIRVLEGRVQKLEERLEKQSA